MRFPACDGAMVGRGKARCIFLESTVNRMGDRSSTGIVRCVKHGNIVCDFADGDYLEDARRREQARAKAAKEKE